MCLLLVCGRCYHAGVRELGRAALGRRLIIYTAAAAAGIWAATRLGGNPWPWWAAGACAGGCALVLRRQVGVATAATALALFMLGGGRYLQAHRPAPGLVAALGRSARLTGVVAGLPRPSRDGERLVFDFATHTVDGTRTRQRVLAIVPLGPDLKAGMRLALVGQVLAPGRLSNPAQLTLSGDYPALVRVEDSRLVQVLGAGRPSLVTSWVALIRSRAATALLQSMPGAYPQQMTSLLGSIILGAGACPLAPQVSEVLRRAGIIHLAVVSGTQISLLFLAIYTLGRGRGRGGGMAPLPSLWLVVAAGLAVVAFITVTGGGEATWRAGIMALVVAGGCLLWHLGGIADRHLLQPDPYCALAVAGLVLLALHPASLFAPGAQLSFAAVWGLIYLAPRLAVLLPWVPAWRTVATISLAPQLAVAPILCWHFGTLPVGGLVANLVAVPLAGLLLLGGLAAMLLGVLYPPLAMILGWGNRLLLEVLLRTAAVVAALPGASVDWLVRSPALVLGYYLGLAVLAEGAQATQRRRQVGGQVVLPTRASA